MIASGDTKGRLVFLILLVLVAIVAFAAYQLSGNMGIEERFNHAVGLENPGNADSDGWFGFVLEGSPLLYAIVLGILALGILFTYRYFWCKP
ncbi:MAG: hypothetical protein WC593_06175 [Methanoregula sp.]